MNGFTNKILSAFSTLVDKQGIKFVYYNEPINKQAAGSNPRFVAAVWLKLLHSFFRCLKIKIQIPSKSNYNA
jgi:hypothetical protein